MKRRSSLGVVLIALALALSACGSGTVRELYTAAGQGAHPGELTAARSFRPDEDLNVVIALGSHNRELPIYAVFEAPDGGRYETEIVEAGVTVTRVLLGLVAQSGEGAPWPTGTWTVRVYVDDEPQESMTFTVESSDA